MIALDTHAIFVYLEKEPGHQIVEKAFNKASSTNQPLLMTTVNWGEIYYTTLRECGEHIANEIISLLDTFPIKFFDADKTLTLQAAKFKPLGKISYADCFAAALAYLNKATLLTGDPEFKQLEKQIKIEWLK